MTASISVVELSGLILRSSRSASILGFAKKLPGEFFDQLHELQRLPFGWLQHHTERLLVAVRNADPAAHTQLGVDLGIQPIDR